MSVALSLSVPPPNDPTPILSPRSVSFLPLPPPPRSPFFLPKSSAKTELDRLAVICSVSPRSRALATSFLYFSAPTLRMPLATLDEPRPVTYAFRTDFSPLPRRVSPASSVRRP